MDVRGLLMDFAESPSFPAHPCFFLKHMSTNNIYIGTFNDHSQDHSRHVTINAPGADVSALVRNFFAEDVESVQEDKVSDTTSAIPPDFFCISARFTEDNIRERLAAELSQATSKIDYCRALYRLQHIGCINISQYASDAQRAIVLNRFQSKFSLSASDFCKARLNK